ncbi:hypothetical protein D3C87_35380 [compost metagenome]
MPYISEEGRNDKGFSKRTTLLILIGLIIVFTVAILLQNSRDNKLENSKTTKAVLIKIKTPHGASIRFRLGKKNIVTELLHGDYSMLTVGDTILIKYAIEDPELVELVDKFDR